MAIVEFGASERRESHERTVSLYVDGSVFATLQASPCDLRELAVGALFVGGAIDGVDDILGIRCSVDACSVNVRLREGIEGTSSSGEIASRGSSGGVLPLRGASPVDPGEARFDPDELLSQMEQLCTEAPHRRAGECVHGCGVGAAGSPDLLFLCEDIGRHNAMDKAIGRALLGGVSLRDKALFITGRISAEMTLKACSAGCPLLVSRKSATDDAIERAGRLGITLVSHCRDGRLRVLTHASRIDAG